MAPSTTLTLWSLSKNWVLILKRVIKKRASKLHVHSVNYAAKLVHTRRALSSTVINSHQEPVSGHPSLKPSWSPLIPFLFAVEELYGTQYQSGSFSLINVGSGFQCLRNIFFFFSCLWLKIGSSSVFSNCHGSENRSTKSLRKRKPPGYRVP